MKLRFNPKAWWRTRQYLPLLFLASFLAVLLTGFPAQFRGERAMLLAERASAIAQQPVQEIRGV